MNASANLFDVSVWIALAFSSHPHHRIAKIEFDNKDSHLPAAFCRATQQAFVRILSTPVVQKLYGSPIITNEMAWQKYEMMQALPQVVWLDEPQGLEAVWRKFACRASASPKIWMDAYLAAFDLNHRIPIVTLDEDFLKFPGVSVKFLLAAGKF